MVLSSLLQNSNRMPDILPEVSLSSRPDRVLLMIDQDTGLETDLLAAQAVDIARSRMPKVSGHSANSLEPIYGADFFGIYFPERSVWFLEQGISPFTMNRLHGRIPMWIDDPTGVERKRNPKAKVRITKDGRTQVLIVRFVGKKGARKTVIRKGADGLPRPVTVPASYPGAPGRISRRQANQPLTAAGKVPGQIASGNVGVRWRHPGTTGRMFLNSAIADTALDHGIRLSALYLCDNSTFFSLVGH